MKITFSSVNPYLTQRPVPPDYNKMSNNKSHVIGSSYIVDTSFIDTSVIKDKVSFSGLVNR